MKIIIKASDTTYNYRVEEDIFTFRPEEWPTIKDKVKSTLKKYPFVTVSCRQDDGSVNGGRLFFDKGWYWRDVVEYHSKTLFADSHLGTLTPKEIGAAMRFITKICDDKGNGASRYNYETQRKKAEMQGDKTLGEKVNVPHNPF